VQVQRLAQVGPAAEGFVQKGDGPVPLAQLDETFRQLRLHLGIPR